MSMEDALKITIHLDGTGICFDKFEPIHLDALIASQLSTFATHVAMERDDVPEFVPLPLAMRKYAGREMWRASAFFLDDDTPETVRYWRKKFRVNAIHQTTGSPNLTMGVYREYNAPMPMMLARKATAYCVGNRKSVKGILRRLKFFGKKSSQGIGMICGFDIDRIDDDLSWIGKGGLAMRWLPDSGGMRHVRTQPPYWNSTDRVLCCEVGDKIEE
jgi:hypothetical protein